MTTTHVAVYTRSEDYGGPEEGGWFFLSGTLVAIMEVRNDDHARRVVDLFRLSYDGRDYSIIRLDVNSRRDRDDWFDERGDPIQQYPKVRPHYE